ncbi:MULTISPECIES: hypothetical protein [unclassified Nonomuraea]|uniref:hypothetical protein n=1 Tax=unclassified Nonomuraea TaxID=2593643 RepID=UPI0033C9293E
MQSQEIAQSSHPPDTRPSRRRGTRTPPGTARRGPRQAVAVASGPRAVGRVAGGIVLRQGETTVRPASLCRAFPRQVRASLGTVHVPGPVRHDLPPAAVSRCR